jgi:hypothetical protein
MRLDHIELNLSLPLSFVGWNQQMSKVVALSFSTFISSSYLFLSFILSSFSKKWGGTKRRGSIVVR